MIGDWVVRNAIAKGTFGHVYVVTHAPTGKAAVAKELWRTNIIRTKWTRRSLWITTANESNLQDRKPTAAQARPFYFRGKALLVSDLPQTSDSSPGISCIACPKINSSASVISSRTNSYATSTFLLISVTLTTTSFSRSRASAVGIQRCPKAGNPDKSSRVCVATRLGTGEPAARPASDTALPKLLNLSQPLWVFLGTMEEKTLLCDDAVLSLLLSAELTETCRDCQRLRPICRRCDGDEKLTGFWEIDAYQSSTAVLRASYFSISDILNTSFSPPRQSTATSTWSGACALL